jgi:hypothetical protein
MVPKVKRFREWLLEEMERAVEDLDGGWSRKEPGRGAMQISQPS